MTRWLPSVACFLVSDLVSLQWGPANNAFVGVIGNIRVSRSKTK